MCVEDNGSLCVLPLIVLWSESSELHQSVVLFNKEKRQAQKKHGTGVGD